MTDYLRDIWQTMTAAFYAAGGVYDGKYVFECTVPLAEALGGAIPIDCGWRLSGATVTEVEVKA